MHAISLKEAQRPVASKSIRRDLPREHIRSAPIGAKEILETVAQ